MLLQVIIVSVPFIAEWALHWIVTGKQQHSRLATQYQIVPPTQSEHLRHVFDVFSWM